MNLPIYRFTYKENIYIFWCGWGAPNASLVFRDFTNIQTEWGEIPVKEITDVQKHDVNVGAQHLLTKNGYLINLYSNKNS